MVGSVIEEYGGVNRSNQSVLGKNGEFRPGFIPVCGPTVSLWCSKQRALHRPPLYDRSEPTAWRVARFSGVVVASL
jgi:hypothetical protein